MVGEQAYGQFGAGIGIEATAHAQQSRGFAPAAIGKDQVESLDGVVE